MAFKRLFGERDNTMNVQNLIDEGATLFKDEKFDKAIAKLNQALEEIEDKNTQIQQQSNIQFLLGRCYYGQAMKAEGKDSEQLFGKAIEHFQQRLKLAEQLPDEQSSLRQQNYAQHWLGHCYLDQAKKAKGEDSEQLIRQAVDHFQRQLKLSKQLTDEQNSRQGQIYAQFWLGRCYLKQAVKIKDEDFSNAKKLAEKAAECFLFLKKNLPQLKDESEKNIADRTIPIYLREIYFLQEGWEKYFQQKKESIQKNFSKIKQRI